MIITALPSPWCPKEWLSITGPLQQVLQQGPSPRERSKVNSRGMGRTDRVFIWHQIDNHLRSELLYCSSCMSVYVHVSESTLCCRTLSTITMLSALKLIVIQNFIVYWDTVGPYSDNLIIPTALLLYLYLLLCTPPSLHVHNVICNEFVFLLMSDWISFCGLWLGCSIESSLPLSLQIFTHYTGISHTH